MCVLFVVFCCLGDEQRAGDVPAQTGGGGEEGPEGEESKPGGAEVPEAGDRGAAGGT